MKRCTYCRRRLWPWERRGWEVTPYGVRYWHPRCRLAFVVADRLIARAYRVLGR